MYNHLDLFSGIGGFSIAAEHAVAYLILKAIKTIEELKNA